MVDKVNDGNDVLQNEWWLVLYYQHRIAHWNVNKWQVIVPTQHFGNENKYPVKQPELVNRVGGVCYEFQNVGIYAQDHRHV